MTQKDIEKALDNQMNTYVVTYPIPIAYPNVKYVPVIGTSYLKIDYLHTPTSQVELGTDSDDRSTGVYQITLNTKSEDGTKEASTIITQLKEYFKRGITASYNGVNVRITGFYLGSELSEPDWYREVINVVFRSDIAN